MENDSRWHDAGCGPVVTPTKRRAQTFAVPAKRRTSPRLARAILHERNSAPRDLKDEAKKEATEVVVISDGEDKDAQLQANTMLAGCGTHTSEAGATRRRLSACPTQTLANPTEREAFISSGAFAGVKEGYIFKSGDQGPGYYLDQPLPPSSAAMTAMLAPFQTLASKVANLFQPVPMDQGTATSPFSSDVVSVQTLAESTRPAKSWYITVTITASDQSMILEHNDTLWLSKGPETYSYMSATDESGKKIGSVSWNDTQALQSLAQPATANTEDHPSGVKAHVMYMGGRKGTGIYAEVCIPAGIEVPTMCAYSMRHYSLLPSYRTWEHPRKLRVDEEGKLRQDGYITISISSYQSQIVQWKDTLNFSREAYGFVDARDESGKKVGNLSWQESQAIAPLVGPTAAGGAESKAGSSSLQPVTEGEASAAGPAEGGTSISGTVLYMGGRRGKVITAELFLPAGTKVGIAISGHWSYRSRSTVMDYAYRARVQANKKESHTEGQLDNLFENLAKEKLAGQNSDLAEDKYSTVSTKLLEHQKEAVRWMHARETNPDGGKLPPFWKYVQDPKLKQKIKFVYNNTLCNTFQPEKPENVKGGILADDMGLGKTLSMLSLMAVVKQEEVEAGTFKNRPTLIVCPLSVVQNWEKQIEDHCHPGTFSVYVYHGADRSTKEFDKGQYDVILTSYATMAQEIILPPKEKKKSESPGHRLFYSSTSQKEDEKEKFTLRKIGNAPSMLEIKWKRVILDEAHIIRNRNTRMFKAMDEVIAECRWCLTGTPYVNRAEDIQSLFQFLGVSPMNSIYRWKKSLGRDLRYGGSPVALGKLRVLLSSICMRRTKQLLQDKLPSKTVELKKIPFGEEEKDIYDVLFDSACLAFRVFYDLDFGKGKEVMKRYTDFLECLLRLRQACCSPDLIPERRLEGARQVLVTYADMLEEDTSKRRLTLKEAEELLEMLQGQKAGSKDGDEDVKEDLTQCWTQAGPHLQEFAVKNMQLGEDGEKGKDIGEEEIKEITATINKEISENEKELAKAKQLVEKAGSLTCRPSKIKALLSSLKTLIQENPTQKVVIFSQFTSFIDIITSNLEQDFENMEVLQFTGAMTAKKRKATLRAFDDRKTGRPQALLVSLKAGGVGLNLTASNKAFMMDLWWNQATEDQAMDRVHRIGQTKPVTIVRYASERSVEQKMLEMEEAKGLFSKGALQKVDSDKVKSARLDVLKGFFTKDHRVEGAEKE